MPKTNYSFEKRQRELKKQQKKQEKQKRKAEMKSASPAETLEATPATAESKLSE